MRDDEGLLALLEAEQLSGAKLKRLPMRKLRGGVVVLLVALRVYVMLAIPLVAYAFVHAVMTARP